MKRYLILILLGLAAAPLACRKLPVPTNPILNQAPVTYYSTQWGMNASAVALNSLGQVYLLSGGVQKLSATGVPITQWNTGLGGACGIATDSSGNVYIVNGQVNGQIYAVLKYSSSGTLITQWGGTFGAGEGQFEGPDGIAVGSNGVVYVSDNDYSSDVCRVEEFSLNGNYLGQWGTYGHGDGQFDVANAIAVNSSGDVYVSDFGNKRVEEFSSTGAYITQWNTPAGPPGYRDEPDGVAVNSNGIYISNILMPPSIAIPVVSTR